MAGEGTKVYRTNGGDALVVASGGLLAGVATSAPLLAARRSFTVAEINAGAVFLPAPGAGYAYRLVDATLIAVGGAASGATSVDLLATLAAEGRTLLACAVAGLTQNTVLRAGAANAAVLAGGASFATNDANAAITVGKTGGTLATATHIDVSVSYVIERV